ncbi:MAG TPA: hypothetical protein VNO35_00435 [Steroidobacteraceae bacterium]|nr:hypothetical protein [Steroidobacteraceae bacterium]
MTDRIDPWMSAKALLDRLARGLPVAAPDTELLARILVSNPARLFGFDE